MSYRFVSPYLQSGCAAQWLKGNHHAHSLRSDGEDDPFDVLRAYETAGYHYFAFSEHDALHDPADYRSRTGMCYLPAVEVTSATGQTLMCLGLEANIPPARRLSFSEICRSVIQNGGLFIADHPNWSYRPGTLHVSLDEILQTPEVSAIEIYTGIIEHLAGDPYSFDLWDAVLSTGRTVYGHAVDDQHNAAHRFMG